MLETGIEIIEIIEKLLDINKNQIKNNCPSNGINQSDKRQGEKSSSNKVVQQSC